MNIDSAIMDPRKVSQIHSESENAFYKRINDAMERCSNVHSSDEVLTLFIDGLEPSIRTLVVLHP